MMTEVFGDSKERPTAEEDPIRVYSGDPAYGGLENSTLLQGQ